MKVVVETAAVLPHQGIKAPFPGVAKGRMADVVNKGKSFREIGIEAKRFGNRPCDLRDFQRVSQAIAEVVGVANRENLRFRFKAAEGTRMNNPIAIAGVFPAIRMSRFWKTAASRSRFLHGPRDERGSAFDSCSSG